MVDVTINGTSCRLASGHTILHALQFAGIEVPALCHDERLKPAASCRLCLVQVLGEARPVTACSTVIADGMVISTDTPELEAERHTLLTLLARHAPRDAVERFPDKPLHRWLAAFGIEPVGEAVDRGRIDSSHPYLHVDMARCILCYRCVRICDELQGQFVWHALGRGASTHIVPGTAASLRSSACVGCGACADTCPSGAIEDRFRIERGAPEAWTRTVCPYCGTGCELELGARDGMPVAARPAPDAPVSRGHLCVKGRYAFDFVNAGDRITHPMIREHGAWRQVSWDEAIAFTAARIRQILERDGPQAMAVLGSARATNEENYIAQKFARVVLGTNNVDCCARVCHTPTAAAMKLMLGVGAATGSYDDIEAARTILVFGANPTENHPILGARIKQAARRGAQLIVVDPRRIELAEYAALHLALRPGGNVPLLNAMTHVIIAERLYDREFVTQRVAEFEEFRAFIGKWTPEQASPLCGVSAGQIREAARHFAGGGPGLIVHGLGVTEHVQGTEGVMALVNLALLTGNLGRAGAGIIPLRGQNNVQGASHMGCDPGVLTGSVALESGRASFESLWGTTLPTITGLNLLQMMDAAESGTLKGLWAMGYDLLLTNANASATQRALARLELLVVQDLFLNETAREYGTVFLPAAASFEKDGTFMNAERRVQRVRRALAPPGEARADWEALCAVAHALGQGELFNHDSAETIWDEIRAVWPAAAGMTYARLNSGGLQWPCPDDSHPGTPRLHTQAFAHGQCATLRRIDYHASPELTDQEFPFLLITGRNLYQFNAGTMTRRTPNLALRPSDTLDIAPEDAARLGLRDDERVRVRSRYGAVELPVRVAPGMKTGELFATFHSTEVFLNRLTGPHRDRFVQTPEYKRTAVRLETT
jgi:formate dehydrogenase major subunit